MDYQKLSIRFSNLGWDITKDPQAIDYGKYARLYNMDSDIEGQLTGRKGLAAMSASPLTVNGSSTDNNIIGFRRLNDAITGFSTYVIRAANGLLVSITTGGLVTTTAPFTYTEVTSNFYSRNFGSLIMDRTAFSNQVWAYIGDSTRNIKISITGGGTIATEPMGITRPQAIGPVLTGTAGGALISGDTYEYRYTFYDANTGIESLFNANPLNDTASIILSSTETATSVFLTGEAVSHTVTNINLYRRSTTLTTWQRLDILSFTTGNTTYVDIIADTDIASSTELDDFSDRPFSVLDANGVVQAGTPLPYLFGPMAGYLLGCGDPTNPGIVYWCNKFNNDAQEPDNFVEVTSPQDPLMNGLVFDGSAYVWSQEGLYRLVVGLGGDTTFIPFKTPCGRGLFFNHAFCVGPEIYFMAKDGIYATAGGAERLISDDSVRALFRGETVNSLPPIDFSSANAFGNMVYHDHEVHFHYRGTDGLTYFIVYNILYNRWRLQNFRVGTESVYSDEQTINQLIYGSSSGYLMKNSGFIDETGSPTTIPSRLTTQVMTFGAPLIHKEFGSIILDMNPQGLSVTTQAYTENGVTLIATDTDTSSGRTRKFISLADTIAENIQFDIQWASGTAAPILYGYELLWKPETIKLQRWHVTGVTHGLQGWQIVRSGYITLRSNCTVDFSIFVDGVEHEYQILSTSGLKQKIYIQFDPVKGKVFDYTLAITDDSVLPADPFFRLYNDQCEIHVKPWITTLGYYKINPFVGGEETMAPTIGSSPTLTLGSSNGN